MAIPFSFSQKRDFTLPYPEDFEIYVDGKKYLFYSEKLAVFSPKINQLFICDPTSTSIEFPYSDDRNQFSDIKTLVNGGEIMINKDNINFLSNAATFFENENLLSSISEFNISSSQSAIFPRLKNNNPPIKFIQKELEYIAEKFQSLISNDNIFSLPIDYYDIIFNSPSFTNFDDHQLFQWIMKIVEKRGEEFSTLYSHVNFENLTPEELKTLLNRVDLTKISGSLLYSVKPLLTKIAPQKEEVNNGHASEYTNEYTDKVVNVPPELQITSKELPYVDKYSKGIFDFISQDGNPQYRGYITIKTGNPRKKNYIHRIINTNEELLYNWNNYDGTTYKKEDQWIIIRFFIYRVRLDAYSFLIDKDRAYFSQMKHWKIYGSLNGIDWSLVDEKNTDILNYPHSKETFKCAQGNTNFYSYFKIEQLENFSREMKDCYEMTLTKIEFFGEIRKL